MNVDASLHGRVGRAEVPNAAVKLFWREPN